MSNPRRVAYEVLRRVHVDDAYSHIALDAALDGSKLSGQDRGLAAALVYGVLTWERALDALLKRVLKRGTEIDEETREVLRIGALQLRFLDKIPVHAAVKETVDLARSVGVSAGLTNAVLRQIHQAGELAWWGAVPERKPARWLGERWSLPNWLANRLVQQYGLERATSIARACTTAPPIWLRTREGATERVASLDADVRARLLSGDAYVQDLGAQRVVELCGVSSGERVLDACAGLGGKTLHLAENAAHVTAVDPFEGKLAKLRDAAALLGLGGRVTTVASELSRDLFDAPFDGVLVDAPCTGLGVIRRHPETRWRRTEPDINRLADVQRAILDEAVELVRPGGWLVYSVCTWTREETTKQVELLLERHPSLLLDGEFVTTMPDTDDADGFFAARFIRSPDASP